VREEPWLSGYNNNNNVLQLQPATIGTMLLPRFAGLMFQYSFAALASTMSK